MRRLPFWTLVAATLLLVARPAGFEQTGAPLARSPRNASYQLLATLDPDTHTIAGSGRIVWRNITTSPAVDLRFHLYWNAWRDSKSSWMREQRLGRNPALARRPADDRGEIELVSIRARGTELRSGAVFVSPDDGNPDDRTVLSVPLDTPVLPGETLEIDVAWTARVPRTFARTGRLGQYYFIAQWFPKLGVFQDSGEWNAHQFHAATEFFSDFGTYDVTLTVPKGWVVGATGVAAAVRPENDEDAAHHFVADDVHDFAWTTSPDFIERTEVFEQPDLPTVAMRLLLQPEHVVQADRHFAATRAALKHYGNWFGAYPYSQITVVDPVTVVNAGAQGGSTGGMEYPMLFTAGTRIVVPSRGAQPESVTVHEAGHQFWHGIVATNEFEQAWMDEGFNTYATARAMDTEWPNRFVTVERYFGGLAAWAFTDVPWSRAVDGNRLNAYRPVASSDVQSTPTWQYWPGTASQMSYNKTALWLTTLERYLGWDTMQRILATYFSRGRFRHPTPEEFFALANEVSSQDLTWFFDATVRSSAAFDYAVTQVTNTPVDDGYDTVAVIRRLEEGVFPVTLRRTYEDGTSDTVHWDGKDRWKAVTGVVSSRLVRVEVDPERVLMLDLNYTNNSWTAAPQAAAASRKWSLRWMGWLQEVMLTYAFFS
ncbi:MAG: M1 family metallopeptidase [Acidobacteria bacterium]|nr:M1 family metallopeptidase [Acidobacteriota bacterium]